MTRLTLISSTAAVYFIAALIVLAHGSPSLAFTASRYDPMNQRTIAATVQQRAHLNPQDASKDDVPRRYPPLQSRSTLPLPQYITATTMAVLTIVMSQPLQPCNAGLLDEYGAGLTINPPTPKSETTVIAPSKPSNGETTVQIDPTLRGSYYYPTAKKRYLPRILKASEALNALPEELSIASKEISTSTGEEYSWDRVLELVAMVDDAVLPLQLYQSSLTGQGLSLSNDYAARMKDAALRYERSAKQLTTLFQIGKKNTNPTKTLATNVGTQETKIQSILVDLKDAMNEYRKQGRLTDADNMSIPSATPEEMRRMAMRSKPSTTVTVP